MSKKLEILEKTLEDLKSSHRSLWDTYGSELCAGDMIGQEQALEDEIRILKEELKSELDDTASDLSSIVIITAEAGVRLNSVDEFQVQILAFKPL